MGKFINTLINKHKEETLKIRPLWTPEIGTFFLYIENDPDSVLAKKFEKHSKRMLWAHKGKDGTSSVSSDNQYAIRKAIKILNRRRRKWHIEYEELGDDLDKHCLASFNEHTFHTLEEFNTFCTDYYDEADKKRSNTWWAVRMGEMPMPLASDGTLLQNDCCDCACANIVRVDHKVENGIESYTPIYGCKYKGKKCKPQGFEPEYK